MDEWACPVIPLSVTATDGKVQVRYQCLRMHGTSTIEFNGLHDVIDLLVHLYDLAQEAWPSVFEATLKEIKGEVADAIS